MRAALLVMLVGCVEPTDGTSASSCGEPPATSDLYPSITTVADDTVTMTVEAWASFNDTARDVDDYMHCRELPRCGEAPTLPPDPQNPVEVLGKVTITYRDWQRLQIWLTVAERWLECAD